MTSAPRKTHKRTALLGAAALVLNAVTPAAFAAESAAPSGASIVAGSVSIATPDAGSTVITQSSQKALINWESFSIGAGSNVTFQQPNSDAITLNRVLGSGASLIEGGLFANGQVWLINGNGILFGNGSSAVVGGLIATTSDISNSDFLNGTNNFNIASSKAGVSVVNRGTIRAANGGSVVLSAQRVANEGFIEANFGQIVLGGANSFAVDFDGDNLLRYAVTAPVSAAPTDGEALVANSGTLAARGGKVLMTARAARDVVGNVINSTGIIAATTASIRNGEVILDAGDGGTVHLEGSVDVSGIEAGESGGKVALLGDRIAITRDASIDASGDSGGGTILIGGNLHGEGPETNAKEIAVGEADIRANANTTGNGGTIAIYSTGETGVAASLSAKGGATSGDGGIVETSGHDLFIADETTVDTSAAYGATGEWLLDPVNILIQIGGPDSFDSAGLTFASHLGQTVTVAPNTILNVLALSNVKLEAENNIIVWDPLIYNSGNAIRMSAHDSIAFQASIQNSGAGQIMATATNTIELAAGKTLSVNGPGDAIVLAAGSFANFAGATGLNVTGGGRFLVFLPAAANNSSGGLTASPFYNRAFDFTNFTYNPVSSSGNRFVYAAAPVLTVTVDNKTRTYGSANPAFTSSIAGLIGSDTLAGSVSGAAALSTTAIANSDIGNYAITGALGTLASDLNYGFQFVNGTLHIDPKSVTANLAGTVSKTYNGTTTANLTSSNFTIPGALTGDNVAITAPIAGSYNNKNVGSGKLVSVSGLTLSGADAGNYVLASANASGTVGTIVAATLTPSLKGVVTKTYDGTVAATLAAGNFALTGAIAGDSVSMNNPAAASYNNKNVGTAKLVSVSGLALSGADAGNYVLAATSISAAIGVITAKSIAASLTGNVTKTYDGTNAAALAPANFTLTGAIAGDSVAVTTPSNAAYNNKNVGSGKTVTVSGLALSGVDAANYVLASANAAGAIGTIAPATLTPGLKGVVTKTYDGTTTATLAASNYSLTGAIAGDSVAINTPSNANYNNKNVGSGKTITVSGLVLSGPDAGNYLLASANASGAIGAITAANLVPHLTGTVSKTYDGTTDAILAPANFALTGAIAGDSVNLNGPTTGTYDNKNAGTGKLVSASGLALSGGDADNYVLTATNVSASIGVITAATITVNLTGVVSKPFDGTPVAVLTPGNYTVSGAISGDNVSVNTPTIGSFADETAGGPKVVTASGLELSGTGSENYVLVSTVVSGPIGIIAAPEPVVDTSALTYLVQTSNGFTFSAFANEGPNLGPEQEAGAPAGGDAVDALADNVGQSLSGGAQSSTVTLIDGLLKQFVPPPGMATRRGVPAADQVYSSWGNEALWQ